MKAKQLVLVLFCLLVCSVYSQSVDTDVLINESNFNLDTIKNRLERLNKKTPIELYFTPSVEKTIKRYLKTRVNFYKKNNKYLLVKNTNFNFLKNFNIFPMKELTKPKNFSQNLSVKMSNMNMNIKVENHKMNKPIPFSYWTNPEKLSDYTLPTFTKKIVTYLEKNK